MVNIDPPDELAEHWTQEFRSVYRQCIREKNADFDEDQQADRLQDYIQKEREHRKLLNLCVFPFTATPSPSDFKFVRADPLTELDLPNFDFLLWNFDGQAIFGEVKANVRQGPISLINEVEEQIEVVEDNEEYIIENYLGEELRNIEYVLATYSSDAREITQKVISEGADIVTWSVHQMDKRISVNTEFPEEIPDDEELEEARRRILHSKHELNGTLEEARTAEGSFNVFPNSDPVTKLRTLVTARINDEGFCFVNTDEVRSAVCEDLFYYDEGKAEEFADEIIELGQEIDFLKEYDDHEADYKLKSRYTNSKGLETTIERKWIQHQIEQGIQQYQEDCYQYATERDGAQKQLGDFQ